MIDVRYVFTGDVGDEEYASLLPKLSPDEQSRARQFLFLKDRIAFAVGRALVRSMLSKFTDRAPTTWRFQQNSHGKPEIAPAQGIPDLRFNLSHSAGIVVAAFSLGRRDIGIDVENLEGKPDYLDVARSQFSTAEIELLESLSGQHQRHAFLALWTLKEAYAKARGVGLSISLSDFAFSLDPPAISFSIASPHGPDDWFFLQNNPSASHIMAVAARRRPGEALDCRCTQVAMSELK
jgi:4'-phosphopantetheinyl transferase